MCTFIGYHFRGSITIVSALIAATVTGYRWVGANGDLALYAVVQEVLNSPGASPENLIVRLEEQAESQPDNPKVWALLFPLYQKVGQPDRSIRALERSSRSSWRRFRSSVTHMLSQA